MTAQALLSQLPLVGRKVELQHIGARIDAAGSGSPHVLFVVGEAGIGKTRLAETLREQAEGRGWSSAVGRAFPAERGVPYALFSDALLPTLRNLPPDTLAVLTRGVGELAHLFPGVLGAPSAATRVEDRDFHSRLAWHFAQFLRGLVARQPLLVVLEDVQWADPSTLELLHFLARQTADVPLVLLCTYNRELAAGHAGLRALESSLLALGAAEVHGLEPLSMADVAELVRRLFQVEPAATRGAVTRLYEWTRGNPFYLHETLKTLVAAGDLHEVGGRWVGWETERLRLPRTVRDVVIERLDALSPAARHIAELGAALGGRCTFEMLLASSAKPAPELADAIDELRRARIIDEQEDGRTIAYDFTHPIVRGTIYAELGITRAAIMHGALAEALERHYGDRALDHADVLAYHFTRAQSLYAASQARIYLAAAGRRALAKHANQEAVDYLGAAFARGETEPDDDRAGIAADLARALQRLGDYEQALTYWRYALEAAQLLGQTAREATLFRRIGLAYYWRGDHEEALAHYEGGLAVAAALDDTRPRVRLLISSAACLNDLGRAQQAKDRLHEALALAETRSDPALLGRAHRALLITHLWTGDGAAAREHARHALEHAAVSGDLGVAFAAHWAGGVLEAFSGNADAIAVHLEQAKRLADELRSPVLRLWTAEVEFEFGAARGEWDAALQLGESAIEVARALQQRTLLPRLLVWVGLLHLARDDIERGRENIAEAWRISGADHAASGRTNVHAVLPAYIGMAGLHMHSGDYARAIEIGREGLAIADRSGYVLWAVHRLLPIIAESHLQLRALDGAREAGARLRADAERLGHRLGLAWADACDALVAWLAGDPQRGAVLLEQAANGLERLPFVLDALRLRRQLAGRLAEIGDREGALRELRSLHDQLLRLGAHRELAKTRAQFREIDSRPPPMHSATNGVLTAREMEIAERAARNHSSKAIAHALGISRRTVDSHLTNIYRKLSISSKFDLAAWLRENEHA